MTQFRWYVRRNGKVYGPYPAPQIEEYLILGRLKRSDSISLDGVSWVSIEESGHFPPSPDMAPAGANGEEDWWALERARARRRWLDERLYDEPTSGRDQRGGEPPQLQALRHDHRVTQELIRAEQARRPRPWLGLFALAVITALAVGVWWGQEKGVHIDTGPAEVNCQSVGEGANWTACDKTGARLAGANLKSGRLAGTRLDGADLTGADLRYVFAVEASLREAHLEGAVLLAADLTGADLGGADLREADLRYATLTGARLEGARLEGARLDKARWIDGRLCTIGSVGSCR